MLDYWSRIEVICEKIIMKQHTRKSDKIMAQAAVLLQLVIDFNADRNCDTFKKNVVNIYDSVHAEIKDYSFGSAWMDLGLHLNQLRT